MKSFHSFITEKRKNPDRPGGPGPSQVERSTARSNTSRPTVNPRERLSVADILRGVRPKGAAAAVAGPEGLFSGGELDQSDAAAARKSGADKRGGPAPNERQVGAQKPRSRFVKGQGYTIPTQGKPATRIPGGTGTYSGSLRKGTLKFSGDSKYNRLLRKLTTDVRPLTSGTGVKKEFKPEPTSKPRVVRGANTLAKPPKPPVIPKPSTSQPYRNLGIGPEKVGKGLNVKGVGASNPVRVPRSQPYSNLGLGRERAGQRVVNRPVTIRLDKGKRWRKPPTPPAPLKPPTSSTAVADKVVQQMQDAAKKKSASRLRTLGRVGKGLGVVGAGLEAQGEYMRRKEDLKQDTATAVTGAATRTGGGAAGAFAGGKIGAKLGSVAGPKGALVGGVAGSIYGYMVGADKATQAFDKVTSGAKNFDPVSFTNFRKKSKRAQSASK